MHRLDLMFTKFEMTSIPLARWENSYALTSSEFLNDKLIIVYVHGSNHIRADLQPVSANVDLSSSYQVDLCHDIISWIRSEGYGLLDIIVDPKLLKLPGDESFRDIPVYLWDNYIMFGEATHVILIGQDVGCQCVMDLLAQRASNVMKIVRGIVQIVGSSVIPLTPRDSIDVRNWYKENSQVYISADHGLLKTGKVLKRHGTVISLAEAEPAKLIKHAQPYIQQFIKERFVYEGEDRP